MSRHSLAVKSVRGLGEKVYQFLKNGGASTPYKREVNIVEQKYKDMGIKPGPKRIAVSTGKPDRRQRDNKNTPGNTPSLKPHIHKKGD